MTKTCTVVFLGFVHALCPVLYITYAQVVHSGDEK